MMSSYAPTANALKRRRCVMAKTIVAMGRTKLSAVSVHIHVSFCAVRYRGRAGKLDMVYCLLNQFFSYIS